MVVLEGTRVRLRPVEPKDLELLYRWYEDPDLVAPFDRYSTESFDEFARSVASSAAEPASLAPRFVVELPPTGRVVGTVGHYRPHPVLEYIEVWYLLGDRDARGHGAGTEAVGLLVGHLFRTEAVERVGANCDVENVASVRLLEKLGMTLEGTVRAALFHHGRWHDVRVYGITRSEWVAAHPPG